MRRLFTETQVQEELCPTWTEAPETHYRPKNKLRYPLLKKYNAKAVISIIGKYTDLYSEGEKKIRYIRILLGTRRER